MFKKNEMLFINIAGFFPDLVNYMIREAKRVSRKTGIKRIAFCMTMQPQGAEPEKKSGVLRGKIQNHPGSIERHGHSARNPRAEHHGTRMERRRAL